MWRYALTAQLAHSQPKRPDQASLIVEIVLQGRMQIHLGIVCCRSVFAVPQANIRPARGRLALIRAKAAYRASIQVRMEAIQKLRASAVLPGSTARTAVLIQKKTVNYAQRASTRQPKAMTILKIASRVGRAHTRIGAEQIQIQRARIVWQANIRRRRQP